MKGNGRSLIISVLIFMVLAGIFFYLEYSRHQSLLHQEMKGEIQRLLHHLEYYIEDQRDHLEIIARTWKRYPPGDREDHFLLLAEETMHVFPSYRFIHYIDEELVIQYSVPQKEALHIGLIGKDTSEDPINIMMLEEMEKTRESLLSPAIWRVVSEAYGAHIWVPIYEGDDLQGIISGDLDLSAIIYQKLMKIGLSHHPLSIIVNSEEIFREGEYKKYPVQIAHDIMDIPWRVGLKMEERMSLSIVSISGILLSFFISFSVYRGLVKNKFLKETKDALQMSERRYRAIFDGSPVGIMVEDDRGNILEVNKAMCEISEYRQEELEGKSLFTTLVDPEERERAMGHIARLLAGEDLVMELESKTGEGHHQYKELHETRIPLPDGSDGILSMHLDITKRKMAEISLRQQEKRTKEAHQILLTVLESVDLLIYVADMETYEILFINQYGKSVWGDITGEKCWEALQEGQTGPCENCNNETLLDAHGQPTGVTIREFYNTKIGRWFDCRDTAIHWIDGRLVRMEIAMDITSRKESEKRLAEHTKELERMYHKQDSEMNRAREIHERMLPQSLPMVDSVTITGYYQPTDKMGGDFYDVVKVGNKLVIYLSDVSGHGLDGSMLSVLVKQTIKGFLFFSTPDTLTPSSILGYLVEQFHRENYPEAYFICIFLGVLDLETMEMTYTGAGFQDTPLVRHGTGEQEKLESKGLFISPIFPLDLMNFEERQITLTSGSTVLFNTDGLTEQGEPGAYYRDRLSQVFYKQAHLEPDLISQALVKDFYHFNNGSLQGDDDISFLILQVEPENQEKYHLELETDFSKLRTLGERVNQYLPSSHEHDAIISCLYELVANAMEHGNKMDSTKRVYIEITVLEEYIQASVEDEGEGFDWLEKVDRPMELEGHTERGRGIAMTELLSDSLLYNMRGTKATCIVNYK